MSFGRLKRRFREINYQTEGNQLTIVKCNCHLLVATDLSAFFITNFSRPFTKISRPFYKYLSAFLKITKISRPFTKISRAFKRPRVPAQPKKVVLKTKEKLSTRQSMALRQDQITFQNAYKHVEMKAIR